MVVPGFANRLLSGVAGFVPRRLQLLATERVFRPRNPDAGSARVGQSS
jgi:hypothetical protein